MNFPREQIQIAEEALVEYYASHGRHDLPWRQPDADGCFDPYKIMVSEIMLQQTQVGRVAAKYHEFLARFPSIHVLGRAELGDVLAVWQGLGYNRRAKFLWQAATQIAQQGGAFPHTIDELVKLPGIGYNTAGAIMAYAYDQPQDFVETNVRTVLIYHFFADEERVRDQDILAAVEILREATELGPREFYWALMDYGTHLKQTVGNLNKLSKSYAKQSKFEGSKRQVRGAVLRELATSNKTLNMLSDVIKDERLVVVITDLEAEGMVHRHGQLYSLYRNEATNEA